MVAARPFFSGNPGCVRSSALDLALLVAAQHQRMLRRGHVQTHDVFEFLNEPRVARNLEPAHQMRLDAVGLPVAQTVLGATPNAAAIVRALQCVAASGMVCVVSSTSLATSTLTGGAPRGRSRLMPCSPHSRWRSCQRATCTHPMPSCSAMSLFCRPCPASSTICAAAPAWRSCAWSAPVSPAHLPVRLSAQFPGHSQWLAPMQTEVDHWRHPNQLNSRKNRTRHEGRQPCHEPPRHHRK